MEHWFKLIKQQIDTLLNIIKLKYIINITE